LNDFNGLSAEPTYRYDEPNEANVDMKVIGFLLDHLYELHWPVSQFPDLSRFLTACGETILTPKSALVDDEVWVLHGASKPVLLRAEREDTDGF
jgi:hypothetical protein